MINTDNLYAIKRFKGKSQILEEYENLVSEAGVLDPVLQEIKGLRRGKVSAEDTTRRSKIGAYFSSISQEIFNYVNKHKITLQEDVLIKLNEFIWKGDAILRENIVLQSKPPLDVIKFKNVPLRYAYSIFGSKEQRWGYGLHKFPTTEVGYSICIAVMLPNYIQNFHNHTITEYSLVLDTKTEGLYKLGENQKKLVAYTNEIIYFAATTPHTLKNPLTSESRNITVKSATGLTDWRPISNLHPLKNPYGEVLKGKLSQLDLKGGTKTFFHIQDKHYDYELEILELKENSVIKLNYDQDKYFFVINGQFSILSEDTEKHCSKNDYLVIDKNTNFKIQTKTKSRLYTVNIRE